MALVPGFDATALGAPGDDIDALFDVCAPRTAGPGSDRALDLSRLGVMPLGRQLAAASVDDMVRLFIALVDAGSAADRPSAITVGFAARENAASVAEGDARMKAALGIALLQYLWRCENRGGLRVSATAVLLPQLPASSPPLAGGPPSSPRAAAAPSPAAGAAESVQGASSKRVRDDISVAAEELKEEDESEAGIRAPVSKKPSLIYTTISSKFEAVWNGLLTSVGGLTMLPDQQKHQRVVAIRGIVVELQRLAVMDPSLDRERRFVDELIVGMDAAMQNGRSDAAAVWVYDKLMSQTEEGRKIDRAQIVKELSAITKFIGAPKQAPPPVPTGPWGHPPMQPVALAPHFGNPAPWGSQQGHYTPPARRGHRAHGGRGGGGRRPALCGTCRRAGKSGADIEHSYRVCPRVQCHKCSGFGHVSQNCPN